MSLLSSVILKTSYVLRLNESRPLIHFLFIIIFCFIISVMMSSLVIMKSNIESTSGRLWLMPFR